MIWDGDFMLGPSELDGSDTTSSARSTLVQCIPFPKRPRRKSLAELPIACGRSSECGLARFECTEASALVKSGLVTSRELGGTHVDLNFARIRSRVLESVTLANAAHTGQWVYSSDFGSRLPKTGSRGNSGRQFGIFGARTRKSAIQRL